MNAYGLGSGQYPGIYSGAFMWALDWMQARAVTYGPIAFGACWRFLRDAGTIKDVPSSQCLLGTPRKTKPKTHSFPASLRTSFDPSINLAKSP